MAKGWKLEPGRHALAAKGVKTGRRSEGQKRFDETYALSQKPVIAQQTKGKLTMAELDNETAGFTGTEQYHQGFMGTNLTDGIKYVADRAKADWMFSDAAVIARMKLKGEGFIVAKVKVTDDSNAVITYEDGDEHKLFSQKYGYTDFPKGEFKFYIIDNVMLLPSEY